MIEITTKEVPMDEELSKKIEFICEFCNVKADITNGTIRKIEKTNLSYIEPNKIVIKGETFLAFNHSNKVYLKNLLNPLSFSELQEYIRKI